MCIKNLWLSAMQKYCNESSCCVVVLHIERCDGVQYGNLLISFQGHIGFPCLEFGLAGHEGTICELFRG